MHLYWANSGGRFVVASVAIVAAVTDSIGGCGCDCNEAHHLQGSIIIVVVVVVVATTAAAASTSTDEV